jgi:hypothetical protein
MRPSRRALFDELLALSDLAERQRRLAEAGWGDELLVERVSALLAAHASAGGFLASPTLPLALCEPLRSNFIDGRRKQCRLSG